MWSRLQPPSTYRCSIQRGDDVGGRPFVCVRIRRGAANCALTVLDGQIVDSELLGMYPPEALGGILVLSPMEATLSFGTAGGDGAILLFSRAGLARPPG